MPKDAITIKDLFPDLTPEEENIAEDRLRRYFAFIIRQYDRIMSDPEERARLRILTEENRARRMDDGRTITSRSNDTET